MLLADRIDRFRIKQEAKVPDVILRKLFNERLKIKGTGFLQKALQTKDQMPDFSLRNQSGERVKLSSLLEHSKVIISFLRGGWCTYDRMELEMLRDFHGRIVERGGYLLAVSPERPENSLKIHQEDQLPFDILYDEKSLLAKRLGISYEMTQVMQDLYEAFGIDVSEFNGDNSFMLPIPATYIVLQDSRICTTFLEMEHSKRMEPSTIVSILDSVDCISQIEK